MPRVVMWPSGQGLMPMMAGRWHWTAPGTSAALVMEPECMDHVGGAGCPAWSRYSRSHLIDVCSRRSKGFWPPIGPRHTVSISQLPQADCICWRSLRRSQSMRSSAVVRRPSRRVAWVVVAPELVALMLNTAAISLSSRLRDRRLARAWLRRCYAGASAGKGIAER